METSTTRVPAVLSSRRFFASLGLLSLLLLVTVTVSCLVGAQSVHFSRVFAPAGPDNPDRDIFWGVRLPRVLMGLLVGAALATSGAALQAILRNPLADPHILGVSGGAALGGITALVLAPPASILAMSAVPAAAFAGAIGCMLLIYGIASRRGVLNPYVLLLAGVVINAFCTALILLINSLVDIYQAHGILFWLIGSLSAQGYSVLIGMAICCITGLAVVYTQGRPLNLLAMGEETAHHLGTDVGRTRAITFVAASLLIGGVIAFCGLIGFVGLIIPHMLRLIIGPDHRLLLPASALGGAAFLVAADTLARTVVPHAEIPVGVVTTLCGGPFFIFLLMRSERQGWTT